MTSALSSTVYAMELLELPKVMPMATRSPGPPVDAAASFSLISTVLKESNSASGVVRGKEERSQAGET